MMINVYFFVFGVLICFKAWYNYGALFFAFVLEKALVSFMSTGTLTHVLLAGLEPRGAVFAPIVDLQRSRDDHAYVCVCRLENHVVITARRRRSKVHYTPAKRTCEVMRMRMVMTACVFFLILCVCV